MWGASVASALDVVEDASTVTVPTLLNRSVDGKLAPRPVSWVLMANGAVSERGGTTILECPIFSTHLASGAAHTVFIS